jgi:hypothetical protein
MKPTIYIPSGLTGLLIPASPPSRVQPGIRPERSGRQLQHQTELKTYTGACPGYG